MRGLVAAIMAVMLVAVLAYAITAPSVLSEGGLPTHEADATAGQQIFRAGGCASCHASPVDGKRARGADKLLLGGGMELASGKGTFVVPNISPHLEDGIGRWSTLDFVNAMLRGVSPDGRHYYPSFPYTSYARMRLEDVIDLKAYLDTLPEVSGGSAAHDLGFPWSLRRGIGAWKRLYFDTGFVVATAATDPLLERGRYLVEGPGHCGECHTPRNWFAALDAGRWLAGAPSPAGDGRVPNITPAGKNVSAWSIEDIAYYFESGFTPDFDAVGGSMVAVQENLAQLTADDREAIAAYLKAVPAIE
ncbi:MAG: cytochrome c [Gammaproteobacteria bacterium]|nr:cytochrome c [Gammaproteobacteria bacterium]NNF50116.1 cytochrome c [Woeseiaceae bacterium]MBT8095284.1 cytochrome c [Gammaproteobacteria bacterium]MBT8106263.1 cytochrome c [Gammaproteobacteria bacterium]NNK26277.1 cytochrome c [Woeseiaceae bacterium]